MEMDDVVWNRMSQAVLLGVLEGAGVALQAARDAGVMARHEHA